MLRSLFLVIALAGVPTLAQTAAPAPASKPDPKAPDHYRVEFDTSKGSFVVEVNRSDAPIGADRLYALVNAGFFNQARFFRFVPGFVVQFGLPANPAAAKGFPAIRDDPYNRKIRNFRGTLTFARGNLPNSRTTQLFINLDDNKDLDRAQFPPVGTIVSGMKVVYSLYSEYGEAPRQPEIFKRGNEYLLKDYPELDFVQTAQIVP